MNKQRRKPSPNRAELNALHVAAPDLPREVDHFYDCPSCGQLVDRRQLGDVLWHEELGHQPIRQELSFIEPMLPTLMAEPPAGDDWLHEIKYDGYRSQIILEGSSVRAFTRNGFDWTERYQPNLKAARDCDKPCWTVNFSKSLIADLRYFCWCMDR